MIQNAQKNIFNKYIVYRDGNYPFPAESVAVFCFLLSIQAVERISGPVLELGVEHGGTAFLLAQSIEHNEKIVLVDLKKSERFKKTFEKLPFELQSKFIFFETNSRNPNLDNVVTSDRFRFIHIDAGHSKSDVLHDAKRFGELLIDKGVTCFDDVFEIRWPGVTEALFEFLPKSRISPFLIVNRKLYCCKDKDHSFYYKKILHYIDNVSTFGNVRFWEETLLGKDLIVAKIDARHSMLDGPIK